MKIVYGLAIALTAVSTVCGQYGPLKGSATRRTTTPFPPGFKSDNEIYNGPGSGYSDNSLDTPNASSAPGVKGSTTPSSSGFQKGPTGSDYVPPSLFGAPGFPQSGSPSFNVQLGSFMHPDNPWLNRVLSNGGTGTGTGTGLNFTVSGFNPDTFMMLNNPFLSRVFSNGNVQPGPFGSGPEDCNAPGFGCVLKYQCQNGQTSQPDSGSKKCNLNTEVCCKLSGAPSVGKPGYPGSPGTPGQSIPTGQPGPNEFSGHLDANRPFKQPVHGKQSPNQFEQSSTPSKDHGGFSKSTTQPNYANSISHPDSQGVTTLHKQPSYDKSSGFPKSTKKPGFGDTTYSGFTEKSPPFGYTSSQSSPSFIGQPTSPSPTDSSNYQTPFDQQNQPSYTGFPGSTGQSYRPGNLGSQTYPGSTGSSTASARPGFPNYPGQPGQPSPSGSPQYPGSPGQPGQPSPSGSPQYPGSPGQPGQPSPSGSPQYPGSPGQPGQPSPSGSPQYPGSPGQPGQPSYTGSSPYPGSSGPSTPSSRPGFPDHPGQPSHTGSSQRPGLPGLPGQPSQSGSPQYPGSSGQPDQPSHCGSPQNPGSTGSSTSCGRPSFPKYSGPSKQSNQPSYVGSTSYPGSAGTSSPFGRPGSTKYPGSSSQTNQSSYPESSQYPGSSGQSYQPGKGTSPSHSGSTVPNTPTESPDSTSFTVTLGQPSYGSSTQYPGSTGHSGSSSRPGFNKHPGSPSQSGKPSQPGFPQYPGSPGSSTPSSLPGFPNYLGSSGQTGQPSQTGSPQRPGLPGQPGQPSQFGTSPYPGSSGPSTSSSGPDSTSFSVTLGQPNQPSYSGSTQYPGSTGFSGPSDRPGFPKYPGSPAQPGQPSQTGSSPYPGSSPTSRPGFPNYPGQPGQPQVTGSLGQPGQPSYTGSPQRPGSPGQPGQPSHTGSSSYPGSSSSSTPSSRPGFPSYPGSSAQPEQPSQSGSPQYPGSPGQTGQPSHTGSSSYPGSSRPSTSSRPGFPNYPGKPGQPSQSGSTQRPGVFGQPGLPGQPGQPSQPSQFGTSPYPGSSGPSTSSSGPDSTSFSVTLGQPNQPSYSGSTQYPGSTGFSGPSDRPGFPKYPGSPAQPGQPSQTGSSPYPGSSPTSRPGFPNYPGQPGQPQVTGSLGQPGQPSYTGSPQRPGSPGQPGQPSHTGSSSYPGSSGPSTPSSRPDFPSYPGSSAQPEQPSQSGSPQYPGSPGQTGQPSHTGSSSSYPGSSRPSTSSRPGFPNYPGKPGQPSQSGSPQRPGVFGQPGLPGQPGQPSQPSQFGTSPYPGSSGPSTSSSGPDSTSFSVTLGQPNQPSYSGSTQYPGSTGFSGPSDRPGFPKYPGSPAQPGQPSQTESSPYPGSSPTSRPGFPNYPGQPGQPSQSGSLGQPGQPSYTGSPQRPGSPGQPSQPSHTGSSSYPGSSGPSTPSSRPGFPSYPGQSGQPSQPGSSPYPGSPGRPGQPSQLGVTPYPGSPGSSTPSSRPGFPNFPGSPGQPNQPSYGGSTPYPGSTGLSGPSGRPGFPGSPGPSNQPSYPGSTAYPGSVGQTYQPGKYGSPSYAGSTSKPPQFGYNSLTNIPGSNGAPISGSIYDNLSGFQYGTNNVTESPNGPYTGPLNTTPHVGCPAALKCVEETYCTWDGVMSDTPVILTKEQAENRVPLSECQNIETGIIGKCCRDPNYEDPWPSDVTHGEGHFGDHGHDHSGHPDKGHNHHHHPNHRDQQGINLITCGSSEICTPQDQCTGGRHVNSVKRCSLPKGDSTGVCCKKQTNAQGSSSQTTVTPSASSRQPSSSGLRPQQPKNPFLSNALNKPGTLGQGNRGPDSFNNNLFTDAFSSSYPISGTTVGTPSPKGNVYSNTAQNSLDNFTEKPSSPGQLGPYSASSKPAFSVTTDLSSQTVRPALPGRTTVRPGQTVVSTTPGSSSNLGYTGYTGSSDRPKQPGFSTTGLSTQSNRNSPFGSTSLPNRVNQPQGIGKTQPTGQQGPNNFIVSSTTSRGESGYYSFTTASPNTPSDFKYTGSTPKPNEPSSFQSGQPGTFDTSTPQSYSNKPGGSLGSTVQPGLSQFGLNSNPSSRPDITLHTSFLGSTLPSRPTQNLDLLKNTPKPTFSITTQSPNDSGATKYEYVFEQSSQTIQPGLISTTPSPYSGNNYRGSTSQTILSTGAPSQQPSNKPISGQEFSLSLPTANRSPGTFSSTTAFPGSSSFGDSPHLRPSFPLDTKRTPDRVPSVFGFNAGIYNTPSTPSGRPKGPPPGFPFSQSPTVTSFKSTVSYETGKSCGIRGQVERPNGPNGLETGFGEFPWQAQVLRSSDQSGLCHGAIISDRAVITSAYCLNDLKSDDLMVKVGDWKLGIENPSEEPKSVQIRFVAAIVKHPKYDPVSRFYDMAVLLIEEPFAFDSHVGALCVGDPSNDNQLSNLNNCVVSGWKKQNLKETTKGSVLQSIPVNFVEPQQCANTLQSTFLGKFFQLHKASTCIRPVDGQHKLCEVDTGSPVACQTPDGRYELAGVYSWDVGCPASSDVPAVTSNVDKTWVNEAVQKQIDVAKKEEEDERERLQTLGFNPNESDLTKPGFSQGYGR